MTYVLRVDNVCQALPRGLDYLLTCPSESTRAGPALVAPGPVMTVTVKPTQRVLFSALRDANPFFHLYEAMWMLAGRDDAAPLNHFVRDFGHSYGEPGGEVHGAYGRRWRVAFGVDQLDHVVKTLRRDLGSRQCVLQMWDCSLRHDDLTGSFRDRPCNTHVYLRVRNDLSCEQARVLDLTVCCRSNDIIWGAHGANAVHFSILQEYLAARIGVGVGTMYQLSNNYHAYVAEIERIRTRAVSREVRFDLSDDRYAGRGMITVPIFDEPDHADHDVYKFVWWTDRVTLHDEILESETMSLDFRNSWFETTLKRAMLAHAHHRRGDAGAAREWARGIEAPDWRAACSEWLERRMKLSSPER